MEKLFRRAEQTDEVINLLSGYVQNKWPLTLWQSHTRHAPCESFVTNFSFNQKCLNVTLNKGKQLDANQPIFCKGEEKSLVFKSYSLGRNAQGLTLMLPEDIRLEELRGDKRFDMFQNKKAYMTITVSTHYQAKESSYIFKLSDISTAGCSLIMNSSNLMNFRIGDEVSVVQIGSDVVNFPFAAEIAYIVPLKTQGRTEVQLYKVGLKFSKRIIFYNYFLTRYLMN